MQNTRVQGAYFHTSVRTSEKVSLTQKRRHTKRILSIILDKRGKTAVQKKVWEYCKKPVSQNIGNHSGSIQSITSLHSDYSQVTIALPSFQHDHTGRLGCNYTVAMLLLVLKITLIQSYMISIKFWDLLSDTSNQAVFLSQDTNIFFTETRQHKSSTIPRTQGCKKHALHCKVWTA